MQTTITIKANGEYVENVKGKVFAVVAASSAFDVEIDHNGRQTVDAGDKLTAEKFKRLRFFETGGADNTITFYAGDSDFTPAQTKVNATSATAVTTAQFLKTNANPAVPVALAGAVYYQKAIVMAFKTLGLGPNAGNVRIGASAVDGEQTILLAPNDTYVLEAPANQKRIFSDLYLDVDNAGDGVVVFYS